MPSTEKVAPKEAQFLLCDDVRRELGGKFSLLGVYTGGDVRLSPGVFKEGIALPGLCLFGRLEGGNGLFKQRIRVTAPNNVESQILEGGEIDLKQGVPHVAVIEMKPFPVPALGSYSIAYLLDEKEYTFTFAIIEGAMPVG